MILELLEQVSVRGGVIAYHGVRTSDRLPSVHITPAAFETHMRFLAASYHAISLDEFVRRRTRGKSLRSCVAVTFDDAYLGVLEHALPILERRQVPATVFVASKFCDNGERFWWDRLDWHMSRIDAATRAAVLRSIGLSERAPDHEVRDRMIAGFRGLLPEALNQELRRLEERDGTAEERAMNVSELERLARSELVDFACHTERHPALPWLSEDEAEREIRGSHDWIRARLPRARPFLAYPFGLYTAATVRAARRAEMQAAFALEGRAATSRFALFSCPRIGVADVNTLRSLRLRLSWATIPLVVAQNRSWRPRLRPTNTESVRV